MPIARQLLASTALLFSATAGWAGELCVICSEPSAAYRCAIAGDAPSAALAPGVQLACIKELATRGGHKSCSIDRTRSAGPCDGLIVTLARPSDGSVPAAAAPVEPPAATAATAPPVPMPAPVLAPATPKDGPPATVEALAKATAEQSKQDWEKTNAQVKETTAAAGQQLEKAGSAVGTAVKKSWDCVVSLFAHC